MRSWRILMFAPAFTPQGNAEAIANGKLALAMLEAGWELEVISREPSEQGSYAYGGTWAEPWYPLRPFVHEVGAPGWRAARRVGDLLVCAVRMRYLVEGVRWASRAYNLAARLQREKPFDVIVSRAFPEAAHLPAMKLSRTLGLPWVANWNDPWAFLGQASAGPKPTDGPKPRVSALARAVGERASWHTFPCEGLRAAMCPFLGQAAPERSSVIAHAALKHQEIGPVGPTSEFLVTYAGRLWKSQDPEPLFAAFAGFLVTCSAHSSAKLRFVGISDYDLGSLVAKYELAGDFVDLGRQSYCQSLEAMKESTVLVLIDPAGFSDVVLTSKTADYAYSGRPILAITSEQSAISHLIRQHGGGQAVGASSTEGITRALAGLFRRWKDGTLDEVHGSSRLYEVFCPQAVTRAYAAIFERLN